MNSLVEGNITDKRGGEVIAENFANDYYMVQANVDLNGGDHADIWIRRTDPNNGYRIRLESDGDMMLD